MKMQTGTRGASPIVLHHTVGWIYCHEHARGTDSASVVIICEDGSTSQRPQIDGHIVVEKRGVKEVGAG